MQITRETVKYAADLSRILITEEEELKLQKELSVIISHMDVLNKLDTESVEPLSHIFAINNVLREDIVKVGLSVDDLLANIPGDEFAVPRTFEE